MTTPVRKRPAPIRATVRRTTQITPHLRRVTLTGDDLDRFVWRGPAAHLKLILPAPGQTDVALPEPDADGLVAFDRSAPLTMRTYTARRFDPDTRELDLDVVLHGEGPASAWADTAKLGDRVAVSVPRGAGFTEDSTADWLLIAGDASALPAIATIAATLSAPATIIVAIDDPADRQTLDRPVTWVAPADLEAAVLGHPRPAGRGQVWVAAEAGLIRRIRAGLLVDLDRTQVTTRGYWRAGEENHPDHDYGDDA
jgi:NADPH-dependent ferric siderophore reductase